MNTTTIAFVDDAHDTRPNASVSQSQQKAALHPTSQASSTKLKAHLYPQSAAPLVWHVAAPIALPHLLSLLLPLPVLARVESQNLGLSCRLCRED